MAEKNLLVALLLSVNLFLLVSAKVYNISDIPDNQTQVVQFTVTDDVGLENNTSYKRECVCGNNSLACSFSNGRKICICEWGYAQKGDKCAECNCGIKTRVCYFENEKKVCSCYENYVQNSFGKCEECDCGWNSKSCEFNGYEKECTCDDGYVSARGRCQSCDCGLMVKSCKIYYNTTFRRITKCTCKPGYVSVINDEYGNEVCKEPDSVDWRIFTLVIGSLILLLFCIIFSTFVILIRKKEKSTREEGIVNTDKNIVLSNFSAKR